MTCLSDDDQADIIEAFNPISRYLDAPYFEGMVNQIHPPELQLNSVYTPDTEAPFWIYIYLFLTVLCVQNLSDKRDDSDFDIVIFSFLDGDVPRHPSLWSVYMYFLSYKIC